MPEVMTRREKKEMMVPDSSFTFRDLEVANGDVSSQTLRVRLNECLADGSVTKESEVETNKPGRRAFRYRRA